ncbi:hypothetical protein J3D48_006353 [Pseudomonas fluorescens]|nr:hypothetical protein [Pseudomonas fluorescens]MCP1489943.1 hypothetical protein [Pseudomonas fluorescens]
MTSNITLDERRESIERLYRALFTNANPKCKKAEEALHPFCSFFCGVTTA